MSDGNRNTWDRNRSNKHQHHRHQESEHQAAPQDFVNLRKRPALFYVDRVGNNGVENVAELLKGKNFDSLDVFIDSPGGDIDGAYQIVEMIRAHAKEFTAVPLFAMSAATLICIAADRIDMTDISRLGPLDVQFHDEDHNDYSALDLLKSLDSAAVFGLNVFERAMEAFNENLSDRAPLPFKIESAKELMESFVTPLIGQVKAVNIGHAQRSLPIATHYGDRLLERIGWDPQQREDVLNRLVYGYPSHSCVINWREVSEMGFLTRLLDGPEYDAFDEVHKLQHDLNGPFVELFEPGTPPSESRPRPSQAAGRSKKAPTTEELSAT